MFKHKGALKDIKFFAKDNCLKYVLEKQKELNAQIKLERKKKNTAVIKYDKLILNSTEKVTYFTRKCLNIKSRDKHIS